MRLFHRRSFLSPCSKRLPGWLTSVVPYAVSLDLECWRYQEQDASSCCQERLWPWLHMPWTESLLQHGKILCHTQYVRHVQCHHLQGPSCFWYQWKLLTSIHPTQYSHSFLHGCHH